MCVEVAYTTLFGKRNKLRNFIPSKKKLAKKSLHILANIETKNKMQNSFQL